MYSIEMGGGSSTNKPIATVYSKDVPVRVTQYIFDGKLYKYRGAGVATTTGPTSSFIISPGPYTILIIPSDFILVDNDNVEAPGGYELSNNGGRIYQVPAGVYYVIYKSPALRGNSMISYATLVAYNAAIRPSEYIAPLFT